MFSSVMVLKEAKLSPYLELFITVCGHLPKNKLFSYFSLSGTPPKDNNNNNNNKRNNTSPKQHKKRNNPSNTSNNLPRTTEPQIQTSLGVDRATSPIQNLVTDSLEAAEGTSLQKGWQDIVKKLSQEKKSSRQVFPLHTHPNSLP